MRVLIVDDEEEARKGLQKLLTKYTKEVSFIACAKSVEDAKMKLVEKDFNLVFLDIQMPGSDGFDLLEYYPEPDFSVIFTTAHVEHAVQAFRVGAVDYLLKPLDPDALIEAVQKVSARFKTRVKAPKHEIKTKIGVPLSTGIRFINLDQIIRLESSRNYTMISIEGEGTLLITRPLIEFEKVLETKGFMRVHNSHIVNFSFVKEYQKNLQGMLLMEDDYEVPISRSNKDLVLSQLNQKFGLI